MKIKVENYPTSATLLTEKTHQSIGMIQGHLPGKQKGIKLNGAHF